MTLRRVSLAAGLGLALVAAACRQDELFSPPPPNYTGGSMFLRYVSLGNSITAGFQSGGIDSVLQSVAYPVLVANAMGGSQFFIPTLVSPGCPPPYTNIFTGARVGGLPATFCAFRSGRIPPYLSNLGVPGAKAKDLLANLGAGTSANALTQLMLGGRTQLDALADARPTFVSVWIGNNDVLGAATDLVNGGDSTKITAQAPFAADYTAVLDSIEALGAEAILIAVANVTAIPFLSRGSTYFALDAALPLSVAATCAPPRGDSVFVPFPFGGFLNATAGTLTCTETQTIQPREFVLLTQAVAGYNSFIASQATARGWAYLNPNPTLDSLRLVAGQVAALPAFGAACSANPFGLAFSCDGVHPSTATHRLIARKVVQAINAQYSAAIPAIP